METNINNMMSNSEVELKSNIEADEEKEPKKKKLCYNEYHINKICDSVNLDLINNNRVLNSDSKKNNIELGLKSFEVSVRKSPKKRLNLLPTTSACDVSSLTTSFSKAKTEIFRYGNYTRYYSYRNLKEDVHDIRLDIITTKCPDLFESKKCLDIGCNSGMITIEIAKKFNIDNIIGIDIDKTLINRVKKCIEKKRKYYNGNERTKYPFNINFLHGNYILRDSILLEIEKEQFDVIICLSVTKWIHLNFGDDGLKQAFRRMFLQLKCGGKLILEAQPWGGYKRRKHLTPEINANYKDIRFFPKDFTQYLLSYEIGFKSVIELGIPNHSIKGFQRPIQIFNKV